MTDTVDKDKKGRGQAMDDGQSKMTKGGKGEEHTEERQGGRRTMGRKGELAAKSGSTINNTALHQLLLKRREALATKLETSFKGPFHRFQTFHC